jgi:hypothetical protein
MLCSSVCWGPFAPVPSPSKAQHTRCGPTVTVVRYPLTRRPRPGDRAPERLPRPTQFAALGSVFIPKLGHLGASIRGSQAFF